MDAEWRIYASKGIDELFSKSTIARISSYKEIDETSPDSKMHGANMGPIWVLLAPDGPHVGPMNLDIRVTNPSIID